jgi:hypothetical protein
MTEHGLRTYLGVYIIILNVALISLVFACFYEGGFDPDELTTVLAIVFPMFACYATAAIRHLVNERIVKNDESKRLSTSFVSISFIAPSLFVLVISGVIFLQARGTTFSNFEQFKKLLLIVETVFSAYLGQIIYSMFARTELPLEDDMTPLINVVSGRIER